MSTPRSAHPVWLVARREILGRMRSRAFAIGTLATLLIMAGYTALVLLAGPGGGTTVGFAGQAPGVAEALVRVSAPMGEQITTRTATDPAAGERQLRDGELDALVTGAPDALTVTAEHELGPRLRTALDAVAQQQALDAELARSGLNPAEVRATVGTAHVGVRLLEPGDPHRAERLGLAVAAGALLYFFLITAGQAVAQGVVEEKSSRVVELLLATIRPTALLAGKVLGIGLTILVQLLLIAGAGGTAAAAGGLVTLPSGAVAGMVAWTLAWFLLGYFTYAAVMAAAASLVSRQEDLQSVTTPVVMMLVVPFLLGATVLPGSPDSDLGAVLSLVPGFAPILMPMRIALDVAAPWEITCSLALTCAAIFALLRLGGHVYSRGVLHTGARIGLREALRG